LAKGQRRDGDEKKNNNDDRTFTMTEPAFAKARLLLTYRKLRADGGTFILLLNLPSTGTAIARIIDTASGSNLVLILKTILSDRKIERKSAVKGPNQNGLIPIELTTLSSPFLMTSARKKSTPGLVGRIHSLVLTTATTTTTHSLATHLSSNLSKVLAIKFGTKPKTSG
jgi:hypothetical protein